MLLNNFKPLLFFGGGGTFKNVLGYTVNVSDFCTAIYNPSILNNHSAAGTARSFDYTPTTSTNSYKAEKTTYSWDNVLTSVDENDLIYRYNGFTLFIGTGETPVAAEDYCLDNSVTLDVTAAYCTTNSNGIVTVSRAFENNTGSDVTIKEMGLYMFTETYSALCPVVMMGRKVLDTPVTIPDGEQRLFEYIINMNNITFTEADS